MKKIKSILKNNLTKIRKITHTDEQIQFVSKQKFIFENFIIQIAISIMIVLLAVIIYFAQRNSYFQIDLIVTKFIQSNQSIFLKQLASFFTDIGNTRNSNIVVYSIMIFFILKKRIRESIWLFVAFAGAGTIATILKNIVPRIRPNPGLIHQIGTYINKDSFPSGHVLFFTSFFGFLFFLTLTQFKRNLFRTFLLILFPILIVFIGIARIYMGAHWFSDVLAAYLVGFIWLYSLIVLYTKQLKNQDKNVLHWFNFRLIGSFIFIALLAYITLRSIHMEDLKKVLFFPKDIFVVLAGISIVLSVLRTYRFSLLLRNVNVKTSFWPVFKAYVASQCTTPLPGGELLRGMLLKKELKIPLSTITGPVITQPFLELIAAGIITMVGSFYFDVLTIPALIGTGILLLILYLISHRSLSERLLNTLSKISFLKTICSGLLSIQKNIHKSIYKENSYRPHNNFYLVFAIALFTNIVGGFLIYIIANTYNIDTNIFKSIFIYNSALLIAAVAGIVPGGLGLTEGGLTGVLLLFKVPFYKAIVVVIIYRLITLVFYILFGLVFLRIFYYKDLVHKKIK